MKYGTVWDAWRLARAQQEHAEYMANKCAGAGHEVKYYLDIAKKRERQGYRFVDRIIDLIAMVDDPPEVNDAK